MIATPMRQIIVPFIVLIAAGGVAVAFGIQLAHRSSRSDASAGAAPSPMSTLTSKVLHQGPATSGRPRPEPNSANGAPTFDIARIEPTGEAVIAGRATPGATIELLGDGKVLNSEVAEQSGEFVLVLRLSPGAYKLILRSKLPDGTQRASKQSVAAVIEPLPNQQSFTPLMPEQRDLVLPLSAARNAPKPMAGMLVLEAIEMEPDGKLHVRGRGRPGATIKLYVNDSFVTSVTAGVDQRFAVTINEGVTVGSYRIRLDEVEGGSRAVLARSEAPFNVPAPTAMSSTSLLNKARNSDDNVPERQMQSAAAMPQPATERDSPSNVTVPKIVTTAVARGDSLWRISRDTYGAGQRYRVIFGANRKKIHNPNLIYPGQIFVLPAR